MTWIPIAEVAALEGVTPRAVRKGIHQYSCRRAPRGFNARAIEIALDSLSPAAQARYYAEHPELVRPEHEQEQPKAAASRAWGEATESVRERAKERLEAVVSWRKARDARQAGVKLQECDRRWLRRFQLEHPDRSVSIPSVKRWDKAVRTEGIEGLLDGNDGSARRGGSSIPPEVQALFRSMYLKETKPTVAYCYKRLKRLAKAKGWRELPSYHAFHRFAKSLPGMVVQRYREKPDDQSAIRPFAERDYETERAMRTIQSDHHQVDVAVHCGDPFCQTGHYPWLTAWFDMRSRKVLGWDLAVDHPNSKRILKVFQRVVQEFGLPEFVYVDNGMDYKKAFGGWGVKSYELNRARADWKPVDGWVEERLLHRFAPLGVEAVFAIPYNAQAKPIERYFLTQLEALYRQFESYRGKLGERSERAEYLRQHPNELPTISELALALTRELDEYNNAPHRGQGMRDSSPNEIFEETKIPIRRPDARSLAISFWDQTTRTVQKNGIRIKVADESRWYRLDPAAQVKYFGEKVIVRHDDEQPEMIVVCDMNGAFISLGHVRARATHDTRDQETQDVIRMTNSEWKAIKAEIRKANPNAAKHLEEVAAGVEEYYQLKERADAEQPRVMASSGGSTVAVLPYESQLSRAIDEARERMSNPSGLSPEDRELARQVERPTADDIDRLLEAQRRADLRIVNVEDDEETAEDRAHLERERARVRETKRQRRISDGYCACDDCELPQMSAFDNEDHVCAPHWWEFHANELPEDVRDDVLTDLKNDLRLDGHEWPKGGSDEQ